MSKPAQQYEQQLLERARRHTSQGLLADAATEWELLTLLRPDQPRYASALEETRANIEQRAAEVQRAARQAQQKGAWDDATQRYLTLLSLKPDDSSIADNLRALERERVKREVLARNNRPSVMAAARASNKTMATNSPNPGSVVMAERNELEHASLLASQGAFDDAITLLSQRLKVTPADLPARLQLADVFYRKAMARMAAAKDKLIAQAALEEALRLDPKHAGARKALTQLKGQTTSSP